MQRLVTIRRVKFSRRFSLICEWSSSCVNVYSLHTVRMTTSAGGRNVGTFYILMVTTSNSGRNAGTFYTMTRLPNRITFTETATTADVYYRLKYVTSWRDRSNSVLCKRMFSPSSPCCASTASASIFPASFTTSPSSDAPVIANHERMAQTSRFVPFFLLLCRISD